MSAGGQAKSADVLAEGFRLWLGVAFCLALAALCPGETASRPTEDDPDFDPNWNWVEQCHVQRSHRLSDFGTFGSLLVTADTQSILTQPSAGKNRTGASYVASLKQDLWSDAALIAYMEGGTTYTLDHIIGDSLGNNHLAEPAAFYIPRVFLLQHLFDMKVQIVAGKIDLTDFFDINRAANCEIVQFLSDSLVNNPTIPFPQPGIGAGARFVPAPWLYLQAGTGDASAVATESGLNTAFHDHNGNFGIFEFGLSPSPSAHPGTYRFMVWYDPASPRDDQSQDNHGFAANFDQVIPGNLTLFFRYGRPEHPVNGLSDFVSAGLQLKEPLPGRSKDTLGCGLAYGNGTSHDETLIELDYNLHLADRISITPVMQVIADPAEDPDDRTVVLAGLRAVCVF